MFPVALKYSLSIDSKASKSVMEIIRLGASSMNQAVRTALASDRTIDITTTGRNSGRPRRIETWFYRVDDRFYLTGSPGRRDWYANLLINPNFTFHLKESMTVDLPARAIAITDLDSRRALLTRIVSDLGGNHDLEAWIAGSPLVEVDFAGLNHR